MNLTDLRDALEKLAGPIESPTRGELAAVERRGRRSRLVRATSATALVLAVGLGALLVAAPWTEDPKPKTHVVTSENTVVHDERLGYSVNVPPDWERVNPVVQPRDHLPVLLYLTHDYTPPKIEGTTCATSVAQAGISIVVQQINTQTEGDQRIPTLIERRPDPIGPDSQPPLRTSDYPPLCGRLEQSLLFREHDRRINVGVTLAAGTSPALQAEAYEILNSLRIDRDSIIEIVPNDAGTSNTTTGSTAG